MKLINNYLASSLFRMPNLIHVARVKIGGGKSAVLFLRKTDPLNYTWYIEKEGKEESTGIESTHPEEAIRLARRQWALDEFQPLKCGYCFTLPERDEHGTPALFYQMIKSLNTLTGAYFDEDLGFSCHVQQIPVDSRRLYKKLKELNRL